MLRVAKHLLIGPYLGTERHRDILLRARHRTKRELVRLIAEIDPQPEVPSRIEPLRPAPLGHVTPRRPTHAQLVACFAGPVRELEPGARPADWIEDTPGAALAESMRDAAGVGSAESMQDAAGDGSATRAPWQRDPRRPPATRLPNRVVGAT